MIKIGGEGHPSPWNALTKPINVFEICHISISRTTDSTYRTVARVHNMQIASVSGYGGRNRHNDERDDMAEGPIIAMPLCGKFHVNLANHNHVADNGRH